MADDDLFLTARLKVVLDETSTKQEAKKAGGLFSQLISEEMRGAFKAGALFRDRPAGAREGLTGSAYVAGEAATVAGAVGGSYYVLKKILSVLETAPLFSANLGMLSAAISFSIGRAIDKTVGPDWASGPTKALYTGHFWEWLGNLGGTTDPKTGIWTPNNTGQQFNQGGNQSILSWLQNLGPSAVGASENPTDSRIARDAITTAAYMNAMGLGGAWNGPPAGIRSTAGDPYLGIGGLMPFPKFTKTGSTDTNAFLAQWASENPGGTGAIGSWFGGPPTVNGMRSLGTSATLMSQLQSGTPLAQTSSWGSTNIGAQSGKSLSQLQAEYLATSTALTLANNGPGTLMNIPLLEGSAAGYNSLGAAGLNPGTNIIMTPELSAAYLAAVQNNSQYGVMNQEQLRALGYSSFQDIPSSGQDVSTDLIARTMASEILNGLLPGGYANRAAMGTPLADYLIAGGLAGGGTGYYRGADSTIDKTTPINLVVKIGDMTLKDVVAQIMSENAYLMRTATP